MDARPTIPNPKREQTEALFSRLDVDGFTSSGGAPSFVDFVDYAGQKLQFKFAEGSSLGIPNPSVHKDLPEHLQMVNANGCATLDDPAYYDLYDGNGSRWRFMATDITRELGKLISFTDSRGRVLTGDDFGVDIICAQNGLLRQATESGSNQTESGSNLKIENTDKTVSIEMLRLKTLSFDHGKEIELECSSANYYVMFCENGRYSNAL
jgi:hypothetical protein